MTLFDDDRYDWRETYFVYFESAYRPKLPTVRHALRTHAPFLDVLHTKAEQDGRLVEMTIASYEDHAAMEIIYREGKDILAEARNFIEALKGDATAEETAKLQMIEQCKMRFDVHHFEQAADTRVFNTIKIPELKFPRQTTQPADQRDALAKALELNPPGKGKFYFDSQSYSRCRIGSEVNLNDDAQTDSNEMERVSPEMLITVLEILCRISRGTAIDPASGIIL